MALRRKKVQNRFAIAIACGLGAAFGVLPALLWWQFGQESNLVLFFLIPGNYIADFIIPQQHVPPIVWITIFNGMVFAMAFGGVCRLVMGPKVGPGNVCVQCSYDLTGNVSGVCPECGTKIETP